GGLPGSLFAALPRPSLPAGCVDSGFAPKPSSAASCCRLLEPAEQFIQDGLRSARRLPQLGYLLESMNLAMVQDADAIGESLGDFEDLRGVQHGPAAPDGRARLRSKGRESARIHS